MANQCGRNPWVIDTAAATEVGGITNTTTHIRAMQWSGYASDADECIVTDYGDTQVAHWKGKEDLSPIDLPAGGTLRIRGMKVSTLSSGILTVWLA